MLYLMAKKSSAYTGDQIKVLEGLEPVRKRPGMYIGSTDEKGLHHLLKEIVDNSVDEAIAGYANNVWVFLDDKGYATVVDDGRGIPPSEHQKIFKPYFTTGSSLDNAIKSHGLGLAGVMVLLKDMGGEMNLNSNDGKGAEFIVKIPL